MVLRRRVVTPEEQDVHTGWRRLYAYTARAGVTSAAKRRTRRRERREGKGELAHQRDEDTMTSALDARHRDDDQNDDGHTITVDDDTSVNSPAAADVAEPDDGE